MTGFGGNLSDNLFLKVGLFYFSEIMCTYGRKFDLNTTKRWLLSTPHILCTYFVQVFSFATATHIYACSHLTSTLFIKFSLTHATKKYIRYQFIVPTSFIISRLDKTTVLKLQWCRLLTPFLTHTHIYKSVDNAESLWASKICTAQNRYLDVVDGIMSENKQKPLQDSYKR